MRETGGGRTPVGTVKREPSLRPVLTGAALAAGRAENARLIFHLVLGIGCLIAIAIPINFLRSPAGPVTEVQAQGYFVSYVAPVGGKKFHADIYIGTGSDGKCHVANQPSAWDTGLCAVRLRQIEAMDCNAVPDHNDEHCQALPLRPGVEGERRPVRIEFLVTEGRSTSARELP